MSQKIKFAIWQGFFRQKKHLRNYLVGPVWRAKNDENIHQAVIVSIPSCTYNYIINKYILSIFNDV